MQSETGLRPSDGQSTGTHLGEGAFAAVEPAVRFDAVGMRYGRAPEILKDLTFELPDGSFHFLTGASGAGKSSLLSLIYLANRPSRGLVSLFGRDLSTVGHDALPALRRRIGVVFEDVRLLDHLNAFDNVALPLRLAKIPAKKWRDDVSELLDWVGLGGRADAMPATLSGGEKRRVAIARAVVHRPKLILADEPTSNVDPDMARRILRLLIQLNRQGTTVLAATHDPDLVVGSGLPVLHLEDGELGFYPRGIG